MELHGENKGWKVFYAAIEPSKIGLVEINGNYHAYIMNYKMAQGKQNSNERDRPKILGQLWPCLHGQFQVHLTPKCQTIFQILLDQPE